MMEEVMMQERRRAARTAANPTRPRATTSLAPAIHNQSCTIWQIMEIITLAADDGGEVVAKEDKEDDLKEGGDAVNKVACC